MSGRHIAIAALAVLLVACDDGGADHRLEPYSPLPVPAVPDRTSSVGDAQGLGDLADGTYWATATGADPTDGTIDFRLTQALFGPSCAAELGADACTGGVGEIDDPSLAITAPAAGLESVSVASTNRRNFSIPPAELVALVGGASPSAAAPGEFVFAPYPFLLTVADGRVTEARQIWLE